MNTLSINISERPANGTTRTIAAHSREASARTASSIFVIANDNDVHARYRTTAAEIIAWAGFAVVGLTCAAVTALVAGPVEIGRRLRRAG